MSSKPTNFQKMAVPLRTAVLQLPLKSYENRTRRLKTLRLSRNWGNEEKRKAGGQGEFTVGLAARRDVASQLSRRHRRTSYFALKKAARSFEEPMR